MRHHLRYAKYVALHKLYVFAAGLAIGRLYERSWWEWACWLTRLLVHDWSKLRPSEWRPYAMFFYGPPPKRPADIPVGERKAQFNYAWLLHQHRNPHHWQHWLLREDSGNTLVLVPPAWVIDEMVADWIGAGTKILALPSLTECIGATVKWWTENQERIQLRAEPRRRVEEILWCLATEYGLMEMAGVVTTRSHGRRSALDLIASHQTP